MFNKKSQSLAIMVLVLIALSLMGLTIFSIVSASNNVDEELYTNFVLDKVYFREQMLNFYLQKIMEDSAKGIMSEQEFLNKFKSNLESYKITNSRTKNVFVFEDLEKVESLINSNPALFEFILDPNTGKIVKVLSKFEFKIEEILQKDKTGYYDPIYSPAGDVWEVLSITYNYEKEFEADV